MRFQVLAPASALPTCQLPPGCGRPAHQAAQDDTRIALAGEIRELEFVALCQGLGAPAAAPEQRAPEPGRSGIDPGEHPASARAVHEGRRIELAPGRFADGRRGELDEAGPIVVGKRQRLEGGARRDEAGAGVGQRCALDVALETAARRQSVALWRRQGGQGRVGHLGRHSDVEAGGRVPRVGGRRLRSAALAARRCRGQQRERPVPPQAFDPRARRITGY